MKITMENKKADKNKKTDTKRDTRDKQHRQVVGGWLNGWLAG